MIPEGATAAPAITRSASVRNPFLVATYAVMCLSLLLAIAVAGRGSYYLLAVAAMAWGWTEVGGLCGTSHLGALTCLRSTSRGERLWFESVSLYTAGGLLTASVVGAGVAFTGNLIGLTAIRDWYYNGLAVVAVILSARELRVLSFWLPQVNLQTEPTWVYEFGPRAAAMMWGMHIGIGLVTVIRYGGIWILVPSLLAVGTPFVGAALMASYWVGRTLPIWLAPALTLSGADPVALSDDVSLRGRAYRDLAAVTLLWSALALYLAR